MPRRGIGWQSRRIYWRIKLSARSSKIPRRGCRRHRKSAVSKKTDYLVVGEQDKIIVGCDGMSDKEEKAAALNAKGASIAVISEQEFLKLL